ncbi:hypothetical protein ES707_16118 [subsurface metagenome]
MARLDDEFVQHVLAFGQRGAVGIDLDVGQGAVELSLALAQLLEIQPDALQDVETVVDAGEALLDLDLVLRKRLDAGVERRIAAGLELVEALGKTVMAEAELADQRVDAGVRRSQRRQLRVRPGQILLVLVEDCKRLLDRAHPLQQQRDVARDVLEPVGEVVLAVVGLEVVQGAFELVLAVADLGEDGLDPATLLGDLADHLAQVLLAPADLGELVVHVGGFVAALLQQGTPLGLGQLVVQTRDRLPGIALDQVLDGGIEMVLEGMGDDDVLAGLPQAVTECLQVAVLPREPPGRAGDQGHGKGQRCADGRALRHGEAGEPGGQVGDVVAERLLGQDRNDGKQRKPGNQEKQPHREFPHAGAISS